MLIMIAKNIPWYVYLIFYLLIKRGVKSLKDQTMTFNKLLILPVAMVAWTLYDINKIFIITQISIILSSLMGVLLGVLLGIKIVKNKVNYNHATCTFLIKGSSTTLVLILSIFIFKVIMFSLIGFNPGLLKSSLFFAIFFGFVLSFIAGIMIGRFAYYLWFLFNILFIF